LTATGVEIFEMLRFAPIGVCVIVGVLVAGPGVGVPGVAVGQPVTVVVLVAVLFAKLLSAMVWFGFTIAVLINGVTQPVT
jgi:hypothetical protein